MANKSDLIVEYVNLLSSTLDRKSRFFRDDYQSIVDAANRKTVEQLKETIQRWKAISNISQAEINANCQFGGLNKVGK